MSTTAVICEYNPFHYGHLRQLETIRSIKGGDCTVVSIMSGNFVQRGEGAVCDKYFRAEAAVRCGADLVLELPYPWSCGCAEHFARGGVSIAAGLGEVDSLCFGTEDFTSSELLRSCAGKMKTEEFVSALEEERKEHGQSDIVSREKVYYRLYGQKLPVKPNDILAVEYTKAADEIAPDMELMPVKREGIWSASESRRLYVSGDEKLADYLPGGSYCLYRKNSPTDFSALYHALMAKLRLCGDGEFENIADGGGGLCSFIRKCACSAGNSEEFFRLCSTKRYTDARIRRTMLYMLFSTREDDLKEKPQFTAVLAANGKGREFLRSVMRSDRRSIDIITKPADIGENISGQIKASRLADSVYALCLNRPAGEFIKKHPFML